MLIKQRAFGPYFWSTTLGVLSDNLLKNLVLLLLVYHAATFGFEGQEGLLANAVAGLFIIPFALFSGLGAELASRIEPSALFVSLKRAELLIMLLASLGFITHSGVLLLTSVFLAGVQAAFYGPIKYAYIPKVVPSAGLVAANAYIESSTFLAILLGTLSAGLLLSITVSPVWQAVSVMACAALGLWQAQQIPQLQHSAQAPRQRQLVWQDAYRSVWSSWQATREQLAVRRSVLAISAFWFTGALVLSNLPGLAKQYLGMDELGVSGLLAVFSVGIGLGSVLAERLSGKQVEIGLVPIGALGIVMTLWGLWSNATDIWHFALCLAGLGVSGGLFAVPLYALIQMRSNSEKIASVIAFMNIQNSAFMVLAALLGMVLLASGLQPHHVLMVGALLNVVVCLIVFQTVPEFMARFTVFLLVHTVYRFRVQGHENFPTDGPAYITPNHISWVDALMLSAACRRPFAFVMYYKIFNIPVLNWFFKAMKAIPIAGKNEDLSIYERAMDDIQRRISEGHLVCIFPEGAISRDGQVAEFKPGLLKMLERAPAPVIPVAIGRMWGSAFSRKYSHWFKRLPLREFGRPVCIQVGKPVPHDQVDMSELKNTVIHLLNS